MNLEAGQKCLFAYNNSKKKAGLSLVRLCVLAEELLGPAWRLDKIVLLNQICLSQKAHHSRLKF